VADMCPSHNSRGNADADSLNRKGPLTWEPPIVSPIVIARMTYALRGRLEPSTVV
jgi:hypothetical protein